MKLILSGGGSGEDSKGVDSLFTSLLLNPNILYIPIAMYGRKEYPYPSCHAWCKSSLGRYGNFNITMWTEKELEKYSFHELSNFGGIFIGGGNTFYLLSKFKELGFYKDLVKLLSTTEIPVIGGSAGALIFTETIETCIPLDTNDIGLKDLSGLKLTQGYNLWVHYDKSIEATINEYTKKTNSQIIALPEDSGLFINDSEINVVGENSVILFPEKIEYIKGSVVEKV